MSTHDVVLPQTITINKMLVHRDTRFGYRVYRGAYYRVVDEGGTGLGKHWILKMDENQDHVPPPK